MLLNLTLSIYRSTTRRWSRALCSCSTTCCLSASARARSSWAWRWQIECLLEGFDFILFYLFFPVFFLLPTLDFISHHSRNHFLQLNLKTKMLRASGEVSLPKGSKKIKEMKDDWCAAVCLFYLFSLFFFVCSRNPFVAVAQKKKYLFIYLFI